MRFNQSIAKEVEEVKKDDPIYFQATVE